MLKTEFEAGQMGLPKFWCIWTVQSLTIQHTNFEELFLPHLAIKFKVLSIYAFLMLHTIFYKQKHIQKYYKLVNKYAYFLNRFNCFNWPVLEHCFSTYRASNSIFWCPRKPCIMSFNLEKVELLKIEKLAQNFYSKLISENNFLKFSNVISHKPLNKIKFHKKP